MSLIYRDIVNITSELSVHSMTMQHVIDSLPRSRLTPQTFTGTFLLSYVGLHGAGD